MCVTAILAGLAQAAPFIGAGAAVAGAVEARNARKDAKSAAGAQAQADTMATQTSNARLAQRRRALSSNSLVSDQGTSGMASTGRATLGGG